MTDTTGELYKFDFLEQIVGISFPSGGYILLELTVDRTQPGNVTPPAPSIELVLPKGLTLIDKSETTQVSIIPAKTTFDTFFFVWNNIAPFPTLANFENVIVGNVFPSIEYAQQFARISVGFTGNAIIDNDPFTTGFFPNAAAAAAYASSINGGTYYGYIDSGGNTVFLGPATGGFHGATLVRPVITPAQKVNRLTGKYLIKLAKKNLLYNGVANVTGSAGSATNIGKITGYHGKVPAKVQAVPATGFDTQAQVKDVGGSSKLNFQWTTDIEPVGVGGKPFNIVTIKADAGPAR